MKKILLLLIMMLTAWNMNAVAVVINVWEGPATVNWSGSISVQEAYVKHMKAGDIITVTATGRVDITANASVNLCTKIGEGSGNEIIHAKLKQLFYKAANQEGGEFTESYRLTQTDVDNLHLYNNIHLWGSNVTIASISWTPFDGVLCDEMTTNENWKTYCTVPTELIPLIEKGDTLVTTIGSKFADQTNLQLQYRSSVNANSELEKDSYNIYYLEKVPIPSAAEFPYVHKHVVTANDVLALSEKNSLYLSGCNINVTKLALSKYVEKPTKTITLSTTETVVGDSWGTGSVSISKEQLALATAGDLLTVRVTAVSSTDANKCVLIQNGSWANFAGVGAVSMADKTLPDVATFTLTSDMLNMIRGNVQGTAEGLKVKGSGITFDEVKLVHYVVKTKGSAATNIWTGSERISWTTGENNYVSLAATAFASAEKDMKLRMSFNSAKPGSQAQMVKGGWNGDFTDITKNAKPTEDWGNYFEYTITETMLNELQTNGLIITGIGYTLTSVDLIDPECEYDIISSYDTADIIAWEPSQGTPNLTVTIQNFETEKITVPINVALATDMFVDYNTYSKSVTIAAGAKETVDVVFNDLTPGFYRMVANVAGNSLCHYVIGYDPTNIVSPNDAQDDFWAFWDEGKAELAGIPILDGENTYVTKLDEYSTGARDIYKIKIQGAPDKNSENPNTPVYIYGYFAVPNAAGDATYPCLINFHGTDSGTGTPSIPGTNANTGWCELNISMPGQYLSRVEEGNTQYIPNGASKPDFYAYGLGDNDKHYYRMAYLDCVRAVDFVCSQSKVNQNYIFAAGGSQGGCLTYVCAGLNAGRIRGIAPSITGHADFIHTMEIVGWPTNVFNNWINANYPSDYEEGKAALLRHQSYFDTKNFASRITCPVITNFSLQDNTDGPHLNISPYNLLVNVATADKQYSINQFKGHSAKDGWSTEYMAFFNNYINTPLSNNTSSYNMTEAKYGTYYSSVPTMLPSGVQAATIDAADGSTLTINWRYNGSNGDNVIPGGTAVMLKSTNGEYTLREVPGNTTAAPSGNLLHGSDVATTTTGGDKYYKLSYNSSGENLGWYWGAENGGAFAIGAHKAWLALPSSSPAPSFFLLDGGSATAVSTPGHAPLTVNEYYDLCGRRVVQPSKGLYIVNGKKVVIK